MSRQRGFTLLEAIVAMVLISTTGMALYSWIGTELSSVSRLQDANERAEVTANAIEFMQSVNPMLRPEGKTDFSAFRMAWQAKEVTEVQNGVSYPRGISLYQLALYDTAIKIQHADGKPWFDITLRQVGYKRVRDNKPF